MATGSPFGLNFLFLLFLLVPGYLSLRGYLSSTIQLDTTSRLDKLLLAVVGGLVSLGLMLMINRFGVFQAVLNYGYNLFLETSRPVTIGYSQSNSVTASTVQSFNALAVLGFIGIQSIIGFIGGYALGTVVHIQSDQPQKSDKDLQQPWETAIRQSALGDTITVVTKNSQEIRGQLYRIGSPSKDYDLLLAAAVRVLDNDNNVPLGVTYHHFGDISQVTFPQIKPQREFEEGNWILRQWERGIKLKAKIEERRAIRKHGFNSIESDLRDASTTASRLERVYEQRITNVFKPSRSTGEELREATDEERD